MAIKNLKNYAAEHVRNAGTYKNKYIPEVSIIVWYGILRSIIM